MHPIKRDKSRKARAQKTARKSTKAAKKTVKAWGVKKVVQKVVPKRALLAIGGGLATVGALFAARKRKAKAPEPPAWSPPPPVPAEAPSTDPPPAPPAA